MKHHISLVGGQILPLYLGIVESDSNIIHFVYSKDSAENIEVLKGIFCEKIIKTYQCDAFNFNTTVNLFERIISNYSTEDEFNFNITGGTKIMALAANKMLTNNKCSAFYFNQDLSFYILPAFDLKINSNILKVNDYIKLSGNKISNFTDIVNIENNDFQSAKKIFNFSISNSKDYSKIQKYINHKFNNYEDIPIDGEIQIDDELFVSYEKNMLEISTLSTNLLEITCSNVISIFFNAGWWELVVAEAIKSWNNKKEVYTNVIFPFKNKNSQSKNEIDILINTGRKLIFIECKSGNILSADINKMKAVRETYGGRIARSLLVSKFKPKDLIIEKCKDMDIDVFYCFENPFKKVNDISKIRIKLDEIAVKSSV